MKIALTLSRFKNVGKVIGKKYVENFNGTHSEINATKFCFIYANLNQSISSRIDNLGNKESSKKLIASMDPRFESYLEDTGTDQIELGTMDFKISNVSKDDSQAMPIYQITIDNTSGKRSNNHSSDNDDDGGAYY